MKNIEYFKEQFSNLFKEMEIVHGKCRSVTIEHGNEVRDISGHAVEEMIDVNITF